MVGPVVEEIAEEMEGQAVVGKLDVDHNRETAARFGVMSIPTLLIFKDGKVVDNQVGAVPKSVLSGKLQAQMA
jgi:thioredoxin 1